MVEALAVGGQVLDVDALALVRRQQLVVRVPDLRERDPEREGSSSRVATAGGSFLWVIVSDSFVVAEWSDPGDCPGRAIAPLHLHRSDDEAWIVLDGTLGFRVGDEERKVAAGDSLLVRRGTAHSYWNAVAQPARYLLVMTPRIHRLIEALHTGDRRDFARIFEEHDSELLA
jgi:mannose-6-phosphate isomerase-like protein (cupin superfamily)